MYWSHFIILAILLFFTAAIPLVQPHTCGIAIPIVKHGRHTHADLTLYVSRVQASIAYAFCDFPSGQCNAPVT